MDMEGDGGEGGGGTGVYDEGCLFWGWKLEGMKLEGKGGGKWEGNARHGKNVFKDEVDV